jgi:hypothetical protein
MADPKIKMTPGKIISRGHSEKCNSDDLNRLVRFLSQSVIGF